jgi:hypothetical protein
MAKRMALTVSMSRFIRLPPGCRCSWASRCHCDAFCPMSPRAMPRSSPPGEAPQLPGTIRCGLVVISKSDRELSHYVRQTSAGDSLGHAVGPRHGDLGETHRRVSGTAIDVKRTWNCGAARRRQAQASPEGGRSVVIAIREPSRYKQGFNFNLPLVTVATRVKIVFHPLHD